LIAAKLNLKAKRDLADHWADGVSAKIKESLLGHTTKHSGFTPGLKPNNAK